MESAVSPTTIPPTRPSRSSSLSGRKEENEIINSSTDIPRKLSFNGADPRASTSSSSSSSSSTSSTTIDPRMSFASVSSDGNDDEDGEGEDDDTLDDDVWVSRRFTMLLSPAAIKAFNELPSFSRTTFHVPAQSSKVTQSNHSHYSISPISSSQTQPPQPQLQKHQENGHISSTPIASISSPTSTLSPTPTPSDVSSPSNNNTAKPFVSPRNIPQTVRHAQTVPHINSNVPPSAPTPNGKISPRADLLPGSPTPTPSTTVPPRVSPRSSVPTSSIPPSDPTHPSSVTAPNGAPRVSPRSSVPTSTLLSSSDVLAPPKVSPRVSLPPSASTVSSPPPSTTNKTPLSPSLSATTPNPATLNPPNSATPNPTTPPPTKTKPPTAPRSNSNKGLQTPGSSAPSTPSTPVSAVSAALVSTPSTPSTPSPDTNSDAANKKRLPHTPPNKPLPPNPKKAPARIYTKEEQNSAAKLIQNNYRIYRGRKIHLQAVAVYKFRTHIANEILNTENTYVSVLRHVVTRYYEPLVKNVSAIGIENEDVKIIFGGLPVLLNINSNLLKDLQSRMDSWSATQCLGDLFLNMAAYLKIYTEYVKNFDLALRKIDKCSKNPQFESFLLAAEDNDERRVSLESYLITPVQRIPRYVLLLQQLYDHTPPGHVDYASLGKAITQIRDVASYINEKKREADNALRVVEIQSLLTGKGIPRLVNAQRRFCAEGDIYLYLKGGKHKKKRFFFLFNDILALTKPTIVQTLFTKKKKFRYKFKIALQSAELGESTTAEHTFCINTSGQSWVFGCDTVEMKNQWVNSIKRNIDALRSSSQNFEERVSKISNQKASNARAAITRQYTTLRANNKLTSSASLPIPGSANSPANSPTNQTANLKDRPINIPILELDERDMAELGQRKILSDALTRLLRKQSKTVSGDHPSQERSYSAPNMGEQKKSLKKSKSVVDVIAIKTVVLQELVDKVVVK